MAEKTGPLSPKNRPRSAWHRWTFAVQGFWAFALIIALMTQAVIPNPSWYLIHVAGLGFIGSAIFVWTWHFADALTRMRQPQSRQMLRLVALGLGTVQLGWGIAVAGKTGAILGLTGGLTVCAAVAWHLVALHRVMRGPFPGPAAVTLRYHAVGCAALLLGSLLGIVMMIDINDRQFARRWWAWLYPLHDNMSLAHAILMMIGFVGMTILGTLVTFGPTIIRARMRPDAVEKARRVLPYLTAALFASTIAALTNVPRVSGVMLCAWMLASLWVIIPVVRTVPRSMFAMGDGGFVAAGVAWFYAAGLAWSLQFFTSETASGARGVSMQSYAVLIGAGTLQVLIGSLSFLLPVVLGGGPARVRATIAAIEPSAALRFFAINGGVAGGLLAGPGRARTAFLCVAGVSAVVSLVLVAFHSLRQKSRSGGETVPERKPEQEISSEKASAGKPRELPRTKMAFGAACAAIALVCAQAWAMSGGAGISASSGGQSQAPVTRVTVTVEDMSYVPSSISVSKGNRLIVILKNTGDQRHDLTFPNGATTGAVEVGNEGIVDAGVIESGLEANCTLTGHKQAGMTLRVVASGSEEAGGGAAAADAGEDDKTGGSSHHHSGAGGSGTLATGDSAIIPTMAELSKDSDAPVYDPVLAPASPDTHHKITLEAAEVEREVAPGRKQITWTFNGTIPGPTLRGKVGDTFEITVVNKGSMGHSIDFHAGDVSPDEVMATIKPGESRRYVFTAKRSGIWLYHCGTMPMATHIASGMYGAVVIDPEDLDPVDREYLLVQGEQYWASDTSQTTNPDAIASVTPSVVAFNGYPYQYVKHPLQAGVNERVRIWLLSAGPNLDMAFHVVGAQFDTVWYEGAYSIRAGCDRSGLSACTGSAGSQGLDVAVAQGGFVEFSAPEPGHYKAVNHAMTYAERGAIAVVEVK